MNQDQVKGKWAQIRGSMKKVWGQFIGDELKQAEAAADTRHGVIQEKIGDNKEAIENIEAVEARSHKSPLE